MIDPICGMQVEPDTAAGKYEYRGQTYFFCSVYCLDAFKKDPERFLKSQPQPHTENLQQDESAAIDPVCGMSVKPSAATGKYEYKGQTYFFCSQNCLAKFKEDTEKLLKSQPREHPAHAHDHEHAHASSPIPKKDRS